MLQTGNRTPISFNINIDLTELPSCPKEGNSNSDDRRDWEDCDGTLIPFMDVLKDSNVPYLKGWFCPKCETVYVFRGGIMAKEKLQIGTER